jgi:quinol monooxygenase YgiN
MVLFRVRLRVPSPLRDRIVKSIQHLVGPTRALKGCMAANGYVGIDDESTVLYVEQWENQGDLDAHLRSDDVRVLLSVIDLASEFPDVRFDTISETGGMDVIAAARQGNEPGGENSRA